MDVLAQPAPGPRTWLPRRLLAARFRSGTGGTGPVVAMLALVGLAAYALLIASVSLRTIPYYPTVGLRVVAAIGWAGWLGAYGWAVIRVLRGQRRNRITQLVAIGGVVWTLGLLLLLGEPWAAPPALSFSVLLLCLAGRTRGYATLAFLTAWLVLSRMAMQWPDFTNAVEQLLLTSLIFYSIPRLVLFAGELEGTRGELARLAVSEQRLQWARDLHDTLGHGLSVVLLKLELVERLSDKDADRAVRELRDARTLLRESIGEMQTVVAGMRDVSLHAEITNACTILNSAGVKTTTDIETFALDDRIAQALAWIVREGSTNVLRHSDSARCEISLREVDGRVVLVIANDGPPIRATRAPSGGHGIRGMRERLTVLGGRLTAKAQPGKGFVLEASVPLPARAGAADDTDDTVDAATGVTPERARQAQPAQEHTQDIIATAPVAGAEVDQ